jgi:adenylate cyclase
MSDIFISYARSSANKAHAVAEALRKLGYDVWRDDELPAHRAYGDVIEERLTAAKAVLVIWSADAARSHWVRSEADRARGEHKLVQMKLDSSALPMPFDQIQCADMIGWAGEIDAPGWRKVLASVGVLVDGAPPAAAVPSTAPRRLSICVLAFSNMSGDPEQEYFSDGISEDIITDLSKVSALGVTARNTAFQFKGKSVDVPQVARQLGVSHVLEGSVRKAGGRVRITAKLIDGASGENAWAERYDRDVHDIFDLQDEISEAIVKALKLKLLPEEKAAIERRGTDSVDAYNLYLMARQQYLAGNDGDIERDEKVVRQLTRAVTIDPGYAQAWALLALFQRDLCLRHGRDGDAGRGAVDRALALDPNMAEAHALKAGMLAREGLREEADAAIATALRLAPESFEVNTKAAGLSYNQRRFAESARYEEKAAKLDETALGPARMLISCYVAMGDLENAQRAARMTLMRAEGATARDPSNGFAMDCAAVSLAVLGQAKRARGWMERAIRIDPENMGIRYNFACTLMAHLEDADGALEMLGPVLAQSLSIARYAKIDPDLDGLRDDARFQAMVAAAEARLGATKSSDAVAAPASA